MWWVAGPDAFWISAGLWSKISRLGMVIGASALAYFGSLWLLGFRFKDFNRREPT
jgi:putative peptidoglycan lipid II flippase